MPRDLEGGAFGFSADDADAFARLAPSARAAVYERLYRGLDAEAALAEAITVDFPGRIALVSSFGAESAVLLDLVARVAPSTPVLMIDTGKLFAETLAYRDALVDRLGLSDLRVIRPEAAEVAAEDADGGLHARDGDACCALRKVRPLERTLTGFRAWITGRKRHQAATRAGLRLWEVDAAGRLTLNPLADWSARRLAEHARARGLPAHPLVAKGYLSIGCAPCTTPVAAGEDARAGRWRGAEKTECGIHFGADGRVARGA